MLVRLAYFLASIVARSGKEEVKKECANKDASSGFAENDVEKKDDGGKNWSSDDIPTGWWKVTFEYGNVI